MARCTHDTEHRYNPQHTTSPHLPIVTLFAGLVGLLFSVLFAYLGNSLLFAQAYSATLNPPEVNASILLQPSTFMYALLFCFILNFLSTGLPAWKASRTSIVNALGGRNH